MPLRLDEGWNQVHFNLSDFTRRAYGEPCHGVQLCLTTPDEPSATPANCRLAWVLEHCLSTSPIICWQQCMAEWPCLYGAGTNYIETLRVQIHANCRIRRIYFSDRLYSEEELPAEFKLFLPAQKP